MPRTFVVVIAFISLVVFGAVAVEAFNTLVDSGASLATAPVVIGDNLQVAESYKAPVEFNLVRLEGVPFTEPIVSRNKSLLDPGRVCAERTENSFRVIEFVIVAQDEPERG